VPLAGGGAAKPILDGAEAPGQFDVSPDAKWIAYESRESGRHEVFIHSFPDGAAKLQVSTNGGDSPQWSGGGHKLVYHNDQTYEEATLDFGGAAPRVVRTDTLFRNRNRSEHPITSYAVTRDGKHFVVTRPVGEPTKLVVVSNWISEV